MSETDSFTNPRRSSSFANLRDTLAFLFDKEQSIKLIAADAGLNIYAINFSDAPINVWHEVLAQTERENKTDELMLATFKQYDKNERLIKAWHNFLKSPSVDSSETKESPTRRASCTITMLTSVIIVVITINYLSSLDIIHLVIRPTPATLAINTPTPSTAAIVLSPTIASPSMPTPTHISHTTTSTPNAISSATPPVSLPCSFIDELVKKGEIKEILNGGHGVAGVRMTLSDDVDVPVGWTMHKEGVPYPGPVHVDAGVTASFWVHPSCEPLTIPPVTTVPPTPTPSYAEQLCPFAVKQSEVDSWRVDEADAPAVQSYIDKFNSGRPNDEGGAFEAGTTIPTGVIVATNFDESDAYDANKWLNYPVKTIIRYGSWGLFQTEGEYVAPNAGACRRITP